MSEMVERVAEALFMARFRHEPHFNYQDSFEKDEYRRLARAAIEAMREPTEAMKKLMAASDVAWLPEFWESMVDEMLK